MPHIEINNPENCCGCGACAASCPSDCIKMRADREGFLFPEINENLCTDCGLCLESCPWLCDHDLLERLNPPQVFAAWHMDEVIRRQSSSGGVFSAFARRILMENGFVVGAVLDKNLHARHVLAENADDLVRLRGSKYVQSELSKELYLKIKNLLLQGKQILFSGTPCQVAGLRNYLQRDYDNLLCCDLICHGTPSPEWFKKYLAHLCNDSGTVKQFDFRYKKTGWRHYGILKIWQDGSSDFVKFFNDPYMRSFLKSYSLRLSCYVCKFTSVVRQGDLTIADYWGVKTKYPEYDKNDKGTSLLLVNSVKGQEFLDKCRDQLFVGAGDLQHAIAGNPRLLRPSYRPPERETFFSDMLLNMSVEALCQKYNLFPPPRRPFWKRALGFIKRNNPFYSVGNQNV